MRVSASGETVPLALVWEDGRRYRIDRVVRYGWSPPRNVGATLSRRYDVIVSGLPRVIYLETGSGRWFVEKAVPSRGGGSGG